MPQVPDDANRPDRTVDLPDASASKVGMFDGASGATDANLEKPGDQVGPYKLISQLGEGGFGTVWLAERRQPFVQQVALKVIKAGMDSKAVIARFEQERQALAVMNHPHVAKVLDGGLTAQGRPYFAMEFVKGEPITDFCDKHKLSIKDRLRLFLQVCEAIQHAHTKGIIHRDLKPGNVLVGLGEGDQPNAKVIDFGVAKALTQRMTEKTVFTETGQMIGTPLYMSPEQADPSDQDIDTRSDVYSLGVILYELLAGTTPFDIADLRSRAYREVQRMIREQDPPSPSARLSTIATKDAALATRIAQARKDAAASLARTLKSELEWIPLKAMRKERKERYDSPADLARDLQNYLEGKPLVAAPESTAYRVRKYIRRNRNFVIASTIVMVALVVGLLSTLWQYGEARANELRALASETKAIASETKIAAELERSHSLLGVLAMGNALDAGRRSDATRLQRELEFVAKAGRSDRFAARLATRSQDVSIAEPLLGHEGGVRCVAFSPAGKILASGSSDQTIRLWDMTTTKPLGEPLRGHEGHVLSIAFNPDGKILASGSSDQTIRLWDVTTMKPLGEPLRGHEKGVMSIAFSPDGRTIASGSADGTIRLWDTSTRAPCGNPVQKHMGGITGIACSPDGRRLALAGQDKSIRICDAATGEDVGAPLLGHQTYVWSVAFSPDGRLLASADGEATVRLWNMPSGTSAGVVQRGHQREGAGQVAFSPDGRLLATTDGSVIQLWNAESQTAFGPPLLGHTGRVMGIAFSADGRMLASGNYDRGGLQIYADLKTRDLPVNNLVLLWDVSPDRPPGTPWAARAGTPISSVSFWPDGNALAGACADGSIRVWDVATASPVGVQRRRHPNGIQVMAVSADGRTLASAGDNEEVIRLWDTASGDPIGEPLKGHSGHVTALAFSPDGTLLASGANDETVRLWNRATGHAVGEPLRGHNAWIQKLAFDVQGRTVLSASGDQTIRRWDVATGKPIGKPVEEAWRFPDTARFEVVAFSPDGRLAACACDDETVRLIDLTTGELRGQPMLGHDQTVTSLAFTPDSATLASAGLDKNVCLWDVSTGMAIGEPLRGHERGVLSLAFDATGSVLASADEDGVVRLWDAVAYRTRHAQGTQRRREADRVREMLKDRIASVGNAVEDVAAFEAEVRADPRFTGDLRTAALIVVGEVDLDRQAKREGGK